MVSACHKQDATLFTLMSSGETNIEFINQIEETARLNIISYEYLYNGGSIAAGNFNNDSLQDLFFSGNTVANKLYLNKGAWHFANISAEATDKSKDFKSGDA
jgi:enediyne biosynthesis protein E4